MRKLTASEARVLGGLAGTLLLGSGVLWVKRAWAPPPTLTRVGPPPAPRAPSRRGPVDINRATREELEALPGIGPALAERIREARPFSSVDDLDRVKGIGPKLLARLRPLVAVSGSRP